MNLILWASVLTISNYTIIGAVLPQPQKPSKLFPSPPVSMVQAADDLVDCGKFNCENQNGPKMAVSENHLFSKL